ncbi:MAG: HisA/HisF-related TIM barrel protein [Chloroflexota bacterium]|nr:HisA/HisF-related TIM barrel protein [Chloroflexota bacterium]
MELICAIDVISGGAVRLVQGDYDRRIVADATAADLARRFVRAGCRRLHVVDLEGARAGAPRELALVGEIVRAARAMSSDVVVELGGGLRTPADVEAALAVVDEALLGTAAIEHPDFLRQVAARHTGRIGVSVDLRDGRPALDGWSRTADRDVESLIRELLDAGAARVTITETSRDGTLAGPGLETLSRVRAAFPDATLVAAGGIGSLEDLRALDEIGIDGAVVGLALLTGAIDPAAAVEALA